MEVIKNSLLSRLAICDACIRSNADYLTVNQVAGIMGVSKMAIYKAIHRGKLKKVKLSKRVLIETAELQNLVN